MNMRGSKTCLARSPTTCPALTKIGHRTVRRQRKDCPSTITRLATKGSDQGGRACWCLTRPVGKPQEEGMMSTAVRFPSIMKPKFNRPVGERNHFWRLLLDDFGNGAWEQLTAPKNSLVRGVSASSNVEPAHNTTKLLCPNLRWGCQSHRFAENKGLDV
jgi:hypothetical protein